MSRSVDIGTEVGPGWRLLRLGECGSLRNGVNFNQGQEGSGIPVLKVKDFQSLFYCPTHGLDQLDENQIRIPAAQLLERGDTVIVRSNGNGDLVGRILFVDSDARATFSGFCIRFRPDASIVDPRFAAYFIRSPICRERFAAFGSGTGIQNLNQDTIAGTPIELPPLPEQRAVARTLGALDDKIELNRHMNRTLEALAQKLFKSWFVEFEPVVAKSEGRKPFGLSDELATLFPSKFEESEQGPVPRGWAVAPLDSLAEFRNGLAMQKFPPGPGESLPVLKIAELRAGSTLGADRASIDLDPRFVVDDGDLIFSWSGSLLVDVWAGGKAALNQHLFKVIPNDVPQWFCHQWLLEHLDDFQGIAADKATTMGHIRRHHLTDAKIVRPSDALLQELDRVMAPLATRQLQNKLQMRKLAALRDLLLPRLLSGEIRVGAAERVVEEAT